MAEKLDLLTEFLRHFLKEQYNLDTLSFEPLPNGLDTRAMVYRVVAPAEVSRLLKVRVGPFYEPSCLIPRYLNDLGITSVVAPIPTKKQTLWTQVGNLTLLLYPFFDGDTSWSSMTAGFWKEAGNIFRQIHRVPFPPEGFETLRKETFDPTGYLSWVKEFETHQLGLSSGGQLEDTFRSCWKEHQATISAIASSMEKLSSLLKKQSGPYVICHADLHPANLLRTQDGRVYVIDWDEVMLAPKERDFIFVGLEGARGPTEQKSSPFFAGYGETEIDLVALGYYRCERVIQDLIECGRTVFFRDDLGSAIKEESAQLFQNIMGPGGEAEWAMETLAKLKISETFSG